MQLSRGWLEDGRRWPRALPGEEEERLSGIGGHHSVIPLDNVETYVSCQQSGLDRGSHNQQLTEASLA